MFQRIGRIFFFLISALCLCNALALPADPAQQVVPVDNPPADDPSRALAPAPVPDTVASGPPKIALVWSRTQSPTRAFLPQVQFLVGARIPGQDFYADFKRRRGPEWASRLMSHIRTSMEQKSWNSKKMKWQGVVTGFDNNDRTGYIGARISAGEGYVDEEKWQKFLGDVKDYLKEFNAQIEENNDAPSIEQGQVARLAKLTLVSVAPAPNDLQSYAASAKDQASIDVTRAFTPIRGGIGCTHGEDIRKSFQNVDRPSNSELKLVACINM